MDVRARFEFAARGAVALAALSLVALLTACDRSAFPAADNTARNVQDRDPNSMVATDQSNEEADVAMTRRIREALTGDDSLSTYAKNVKIITVGGIVTLRGPVANEPERATVLAKAEQIAGPGHVVNQLEVTRGG